MIKESHNSTSAISEEPSARPKKETPADIFHELREKKRKEHKVAPDFPPAESLTPKQPRILLRLFIATLLGVVIGFAGSKFLTGVKATPANHYPSQELPPENTPVHHEESALEIESLKSKHGAVDWADSLPAFRRKNPFSIELEDAFIRPDARPVVVHGTLLDIAYGNLGIVVKFGIPVSSSDLKNVLILEIRKEQLKIFAGATRGISEYAVVAKCNNAQSNEGGERAILGRLIDVVELGRK